jgi:hypothetical protein
MSFPQNLGVIVCRCVLERRQPVLFVSHAGGDWQMYCHWKNHDFDSPETQTTELCIVHIEHLLAQDETLNSVADLPVNMGAERKAQSARWKRYEDKDDE